MGFSGENFLGIVTPLGGIGLFFASAYSLWNTSYLHLPLSRLNGFLSTFLPIFALGTVQYIREGSLTVSQGGQGKSRNVRRMAPRRISDRMLVVTFSLLLADATLFTLGTTSMPSKPLLCPLNDSWQAMWASPAEKNSLNPSIKTIQDTLGCCGLHSNSDKFYPFPPYENNTKPICTKWYPDRVGRTCFQPWMEQAQQSAGMFLAAALGSAFMKLAALFLIRYKTSPLVQWLLYNPWFGKPEQGIPQTEESNSEGRIHDVEDEEYSIYTQARRNGTDKPSISISGKYISAPRENDRLLGPGNGRPSSLVGRPRENDRLLGNGRPPLGFGGGIEENRWADNQSDGGFGTIQPGMQFGTNQTSSMFGTNQPNMQFGTNQPNMQFGTNQPSMQFGTNQTSSMFG